VNSQWPVIASGFSSLKQSAMSWPLVRFAPSEPCQVSPPSSSSTLSSPRCARTAFTTVGQPIEPADAAIASRQRGKILRRERIGMRGLRRNVEVRQEILAGDVRRQPLRVTDTEIGRGLAEMHRHELAMHVGDVQQRDVAHRPEAKKLILGQSLLREGARPAVRNDGRRGGRDLEEFAAGEHRTSQCHSGTRA
jgi:hypothetical protein